MMGSASPSARPSARFGELRRNSWNSQTPIEKTRLTPSGRRASACRALGAGDGVSGRELSSRPSRPSIPTNSKAPTSPRLVSQGPEDVVPA